MIMKYYNCPDIFKNAESLEYLTSGYYFRSDNDNCTTYLISPKEINNDKNAIMYIYESGCIQYGDPIINQGDEVATLDDLELLCTVTVWGKYFFPVYEEIQMYYCYKKYHGEKYASDQVQSMAEALNFAVEKGLKLANIKPY